MTFHKFFYGVEAPKSWTQEVLFDLIRGKQIDMYSKKLPSLSRRIHEFRKLDIEIISKQMSKKSKYGNVINFKRYYLYMTFENQNNAKRIYEQINSRT